MSTTAPVDRHAPAVDVVLRADGGLYIRPLKPGPFHALHGLLFYAWGYVRPDGAAANDDGAQVWEIGACDDHGLRLAGFAFNVTGLRVWQPDAPHQAQRLWYEGRGFADTTEPPPAPDVRPDDLRYAADAREALVKFSDQLGKGRGRRKGDGATWPSKAAFLTDLWNTVDRYRAETGRPWPLITGTRGQAFRRMMEGHPSERTLRDWLSDAKLRPQDVEAGDVTRANYSQFVAERGL